MAAGGNDDTVAGTIAGIGGTTTSGASAIPTGGGGGGQKIANRYEIVRLLGGGGMGRVYEALDGELGERIALKVLHAGLADDSSLERFRREVRLTRKIQHKNVARMFDIGDHGGEKFLTMELVEGEALTRALGTTAMPWHRLRTAALQIAAGLAAAHDCGVVHRDLKPDNVLVELATNRHVITDFGIARGGGDPNVTQVGAVVGTPRYMAPEQLAGRETDHRADLFSLGVMLYEMASGAGVRPWPGDNLISIAVAQATQPARPLVAGADVPEAFVALVMACLALDPADRPQRAQDIVDRIASETANVARTATPPYGTPAAGSVLNALPTVNAALPTAQSAAIQHMYAPQPSAVRPPTSATLAFQPHVDTSLAVLPIACGPGDEYLADGLQEDLIDTLSTMQGVRVRPAGLARGVAEPDVRELGKRLDVEQVVSVSLRRLPGAQKLRVAARLISIADGFQIWAHRAECTDAEIFVQSEVLAQGIAGALSSRAVQVTKPTDPRAVDLYLRARAELRQFWGQHAKAAAELLAEAARLAPDSAPILGAMAYATVQAWVMVADETLLEPARAALAQGLATGHGEAYLASAILKFNFGDTLAAATDLRTAIMRAPMSAQTHEYVAKILVEIGRVAEAKQHFATAVGLDPGRAMLVQSDLSRLAALEGDLETARTGIAALERSPDASLVQLAMVFHARVEGWRGNREPLRQAATRLATRFGANALELARIVHAVDADHPVDRAGWDRYAVAFMAEPKPRRLQLLAFQLMAESAAVVGADDIVFSSLDHVATLGLLDIVWMDKLPLFERFRADLRWHEVRTRVHAHAEAVSAVLRDF